jgi:chaperonin GroEL
MDAVDSTVRELDGDLRTGTKILLRALEEPTRQIIHNAGVDEAAVIVREIRSKKGALGYDANTGHITDLVKAGIVDPAKVTKHALQNAGSIAGLLLTTEALVVDAPEKKKAAAQMPPYDDEDLEY